MKKIGKQLISFGVCVLLAAGTACGGGSHNVSYDEYNMAELTYPDYEETPADKNSWEYLDAGKETTIEWYVDVSSWAIPAENDVIRKIKEKTGITVKFMTPVTDDGSKLATLISSGLPDVVSVPTSSSKTIASLAQQGYVYDINTLADKWAPTLYQHFPEDVFDWWSYGNGKTYGLPNHYYSYEDVPDEKLQPNGGMMVRKDIFDAWQSHVEKNLKGADGYVSYTSASGATKKVEWQGYITTPEGFKAAAEWAMQNYYGTGKGQITTALQLSQFTSSGCTSLEWLAQFFAVPFEDEEGNYLYRFTQEGYADVLYYINDLYRTKVNGNNLISESNFTQTYDGVGSVIAGGKAFATLVTPQDYQMHYVTAKDDGYEYVSMYITNEEGDAPVLADINGITYQMDENICQMKTMKVDIATETGLGTLTYENASGVHTLSFGLGYNTFAQFPDYDLKYAASAAFRMENTLLVKIQIIDSAIGNLFFSLNFKGDYVTVMLRKIEESLFGEYNGVFSGRKI